nr:sodium:alanine symporter family protein [Feifania hominis]
MEALTNFFTTIGERLAPVARGFENVVNTVNAFVWGPFMLVLLVGTGIFFTVRCNFLQIKRFFFICKNTIGSLFGGSGRRSGKRGISPFQALTTALAGTIGTGNIVGVATAIIAGGPGALFWMWVSAFFGMATKYAEIVLAIKFRTVNERGEYVGGPMYYIEKGLHLKPLAVVFALFAALASFGIGNMTQVNSISANLRATFHIPPLVTGLVAALIVGLVILGGIRRIGSVTEKMVPFMAIPYLLGGVAILVVNRAALPDALSLVFREAFSFRAVGGGVAGYVIFNAMKYGVARGVFSNEAGLGSAPIVHAAADVDHPVKQGVWGVFEVFFDTILGCSVTAFAILTSGLLGSGIGDAEISSAAFELAFPGFGSIFVTVAMVFFAFSTILGWSYYGERCVEYLFGGGATVVYKIIYLAAIVVGATLNLSLVWKIADTLNGLMAIPNLIALLGLSGVVIKTTRDYFRRPLGQTKLK